MKYLISSEGNSLESSVSSHFGRAPFFLIYDDAAKSLEVKANGDGVDPHMVIHDAAKSGVGKMICGGIGPHAYQVAEKFNVQVNVVSGIPVKDAVEKAAAGSLPVTDGPTFQHHHNHSDRHHLPGH